MTSADERIHDLLEDFGSAGASAGWLLCDRHPDGAVAFTVVDGAAADDITYGRLREASLRLADSFRGLGLGPGDRIATLVRKGPELVTTMLAAWRIGAVYVPLFTAFAAGAISFRLVRADVRLVVTDAAQRPKLDVAAKSLAAGHAPWRIVTVDDDARGSDLRYDELVSEGSPEPAPAHVQGGDGAIVHTFTSGTTGEPKGVVHPLRYGAGWDAYLEFGLGVTEDSRLWCAADPGWAYGLYSGIVAPLSTGRGNILQVGGFTPETTWRLMAELGVTDFAAAPTVYRALRNQPSLLPRTGLALRRLSSAGEPLTPEINAWASDALGLTVRDHYGQTEVGMVFANHHHPQLARDVVDGSMGQRLPGWDTVVLGDDDAPLGVGETGRMAIDVTSPLMTFRSYQNPRTGAQRFTRDGRYFILGDLGHEDEDGYVHFSSRDDDVILMAGYRIGPFEVESAISRHPGVAECAVVAAPDEMRGEVVEAFVVVSAGVEATPELAAELQAAVKHGYSAHAYPRAVHFVDALPKTPSGKVQRFVLRERRRAEAEAGAGR